MGGTFKIALSLAGDPHIELPSAFVLSSPDKYSGRLLPHINLGWYLCYVQEMEADWDANDLQATYQQIDTQIQLTLNNSVVSANEGHPDDIEMEGEFASYWLPDKTVYLLSDAVEDGHLQCMVSIAGSNGSSTTDAQDEEWVAYHETHKHECDAWLKQRGLTPRDANRFHTSYFRIKPSRLAGLSWPPTDFKAVLDWLSNVDREALTRILNHFVDYPMKRHLLLLDVFQQDMIGFYVELNLKAVALHSYATRKNHRKGKRRTIKPNTLAMCLSGKLSVNKFIRLGVIKTDRKSILSRNRPRPDVGDLSNKRIALIGCGTIGGYLAGLLLRAGAGCGKGCFHLFDHDDIQPHNFGRHPLTTADFGQNKAVAMANSLMSSSHLVRNVKGCSFRFPIERETILQLKYDIIIDATGRPPVSKRLASVVRTMSSTDRPILVHGFNDGNGRSSKVVVDDGTCCFGCLFANSAFYKDGIDLRFKDIDRKAERIISCGSTYTPYDAAVSVITASMMQEAVLQALEPLRSWTYSEHMLDGSRSRKPYRMSSQPKCDICHGQGRTDV